MRLSVSLGLWQDRPAAEGVRAAQGRGGAGDGEVWGRGAGSLPERTGRTVNVALGSSSPVVVEQWHGRRQERTALALAESAAAVRTLVAGGQADVRGAVVINRGFLPRTRAPGSSLTIAGFGRGAVRVAARQADRMVINLVTPKSAARLVQRLHHQCRVGGAPGAPVAGSAAH